LVEFREETLVERRKYFVLYTLLYIVLLIFVLGGNKCTFIYLLFIYVQDPLAADEDAPQMLLQPLSSKQDRDKIKEQEREVPYRHFFTVLNQVPRGSEVV
jgi:hypothetical protein